MCPSKTRCIALPPLRAPSQQTGQLPAAHCQTARMAGRRAGASPDKSNGEHKKNMLISQTLTAAAALALGLAAAPASLAFAETPADTLVIADKIDDIVSLDPAESFEFSGNDLLNNVYDSLIELDPTNLGPLVPGLAESWEVGRRRRHLHLQDAPGRQVPLRQPGDRRGRRLVAAARGDPRQDPGLHPDPVRLHARRTSPRRSRPPTTTTLVIVTDKPYAPTFFFNCLTSIVASIVDKTEAMAHEANGDFGYEWLKTNSAGSGAYKLRAVQAVRQLRPRGGAGRLARRAAAGAGLRAPRRRARHPAAAARERRHRHRPQAHPGRRRRHRAATPTSRSSTSSAAASTTSALNQKVEPLNNPKVIEAVKYLIDYQGMADSFLKGSNIVHQSFLPAGFLGAHRRQALHARRREGQGAARRGGRRADQRQALRPQRPGAAWRSPSRLQNTLAQAGITVELRVGTGAEILGEYRARNHEMTMEAWGPDYPDPHTNADTFARNPDNSRRGQATPASSPGATPGRRPRPTT